jgi:ssDNA-binding Zn-finger/Zn-ribbon topoisomerase 1
MINVTDILETGKGTSRMQEAVEYSEQVMIHTKGGKALEKYLAQINSYENKAQYDLRKKFAISNKFITSKLLRPCDNIWNAKGGSTKLEMKGENSTKGMNLILKEAHNYIRNTWFDAFINDPNGVTIIEYEAEDEEMNFKYLPSERIEAIEIAKEKVIEILIFIETIEEGENKIKKYLHITKDMQAEYFVKDENTVIRGDATKNETGIVPVVLNSTVKTIEKDIYISMIDTEIELLNSFVRKNSVKEIFEFLHGFPKFWQYVEPCDVCGGAKRIQYEQRDGSTGYQTCPKCNGIGHFGKTDVADVLNIAMPESGDETIANQPMGFEIPPVETWQEMRSELDWLWNIIFDSQWGTTVQKQTNETATGRFIDVQPVINKLDSYAEQLQRVFNEIGIIAGKTAYPNTFEQFSIAIGRNFIIDTPSAALTRYKEAKEKGLNTNILNHLLKQYFLSEFANNDRGYQIAIKLMNVEPFPHHTIDEVMQFARDEDKAAKVYYEAWLSETENSEILEKTAEQLRKELYSKAPELGSENSNIN